MRPFLTAEMQRTRRAFSTAFPQVSVEIWRDPDLPESNADDAGFIVTTGEPGQVVTFEIPGRFFPASWQGGQEQELEAQMVNVQDWIFVFNPDDFPSPDFEIRGSDTLKVGSRSFEVMEPGDEESFNISHRVRCKEIKNG